MLKLCLRVAQLLRKHPILWLPYIAADLLAICLWRLRGLAERGIFNWFTTGHSALGGDIALPRHDPATVAKASLAYAPIGITTIVAVVCLFVGALLATAAILDSIERQQRSDTREILAELAAHWRRILLFALRFLLTLGVLVAATTDLSYYMLFLTHHQDLLTSFGLLTVQILLGIGCTAWLVIPATMRLINGETAMLVPPKTRSRGTILVILATEAGVALGFFMPKLESSILVNSRLEVVIRSVINSIIANAPDALLFVALALLASELSQASDIKEGSKIRELLSLLMPLHFGNSEEPPGLER